MPEEAMTRPPEIAAQERAREQAAVMLAFAEGKKLQMRLANHPQYTGWERMVVDPDWDWKHLDYRVAPELPEPAGDEAAARKLIDWLRTTNPCGMSYQQDAADMIERLISQPQPPRSEGPPPHVEPNEFAKEVATMDEIEMRRRLLIFNDWMKQWSRCLDGLPIPKDCDACMDACRHPRDVRSIVEKLISKIQVSAEPTLPEGVPVPEFRYFRDTKNIDPLWRLSATGKWERQRYNQSWEVHANLIEVTADPYGAVFSREDGTPLP